LTIQVISPPNSKKVYLIVGLGLLGKRISKQFTKSIEIGTSIFINNDWNNKRTFLSEVEPIIDPSSNIEIVWSAGKSGFASSDQQMQIETDYLINAIEIISNLSSNVTVNIISSAGGIYEGSGRVSHVDQIAPLRPYGDWKIKQENYLKASVDRCRIYRASSIYGIGEKYSRKGLINLLVARSIDNGYANIYGLQTTLRDYVYHDDVAHYIVATILSSAPSMISILASGRATSINTLQNMIEQITGRIVKVTFQRVSEEKNIIFDKHLVPKNLNKTTLEEGIRLTDIMHRT